MRRDLIIGILVAVAVHGGVVWVSQVNKKGPPVAVKLEEAPVIQIKMPPIEPEEVEEPEEQAEEVAPQEFAPPMQQDVLLPPPPEQVFIQKIQPPVPENLAMNTGQITIPNTRLTGLGEIFDASKLDQQAQPTFQPPPEYPFEMRRSGVEAKVDVEFIVDTNGQVVSAFAVSGPKEFQPAAVAGVKKWKFKPGKKAGKAVGARMLVEITFTLK